MTYKVTEEGNVSTVFLNGEIDMDVTEKAKEVIFPHIDAGKEVHLNLSNVQYMDSSGISVLIESCLLYTSPSPRDCRLSRMPSSA